MADSHPYVDFVVSNHPLYDRYYKDWRLQEVSYYGSTEYKHARLLRAYTVDLQTPAETVSTYVTDESGAVVAKRRATVENNPTNSPSAAGRGDDVLDGSFYGEKLDNTPLYNYVKLIVAEYSAMLWRNPPQRVLAETPEIQEFIEDVDGEGNSVNEFMSLVDTWSTIYGVVHVGCYKPVGSDIPKWKLHKPTDVTNWEYTYDRNGNLELSKVAIKIEDSDVHSIYRVMTADTIDTVFMGKDDDYVAPIDDPDLLQLDEAVFMISQPNELGYVPLKTFYQSVKVYNNVGTTVIQDVAGIQRSIYSYLAEIYSAVTYSSHPTLIVDETTSQMNDGSIGAEPGSVVTVQAGLTGETAYVYEFASPQLDSIEQIQKLIDSQIDKLTQIAMLRSEDLIKASRSGEQIEVYDDKLAAQIRRKAINLENGESKLWDIWFDWTNQTKPEDFGVSYNRQYNKKALEHELNEINLTMQLLEKYENMFDDAPNEEYATVEEAVGRAQQLGGDGYHSHTKSDGGMIYMPFSSHSEFEAALGYVDLEADFKDDVRETIKQRLQQLLNASSTMNGL